MRRGLLRGGSERVRIGTPCRDPFGKPEEVETYDLSAAVTVQWLADGDHSLAPRKRSGYTAEAHLNDALDATAAFFTNAC